MSEMDVAPDVCAPQSQRGKTRDAAGRPERHRRIAVFLYALTGGGAQRRALTLVEGFIEHGYDVDVVTVRGLGVLNASLPPLARHIALDATWSRWHPGSLTGKRGLKGYLAIPALARYLARSRPDLLLSAASHANIPAILGWRFAGRLSPLILRASNHPYGNLQHRPRRFRLSKPIYNRIGGLLYARADAVIAVSHGVADAVRELMRAPAQRVVTIYNPVVGVGNAVFVEDLAPPVPPHPWLAPGNPPVILGAGRLAVQKDFATLVRAFAALRRQCPARLVILGEGAKRRDLERLVRELGVEADVLLPGYVPDVSPWMASAAVFVLPSLWEGLPGVLIESLAVGCPIVAVDCPSGPREILVDGLYGKLVPARAPEAMAAAISATLDAPPPRDLLRSRAADFGRDRGIAQYVEVVESLIPPGP